jgi:hypothetical protein
LPPAFDRLVLPLAPDAFNPLTGSIPLPAAG